jgi:hypothetical protein
MNALASYLVGRARGCLTTFAALAVFDERTGNPGRLARHQRRWFDLWTTRRRTVVIAPSEFGKSVSLAMFIAWRIGADPSLRVALLSATQQQACRLLRLVAIVIRGEAFRCVFPSVAIDRHTGDELAVTGRPATMKDASVIAAAFDLSSMLGVRVDLAACDDVVARESVRTEQARDAAFQSFLAVTASRVAPTGEIHVVNTAEHSDDIPHRLGRLPGWHQESFPALDAEGTPTWSERWPAARIEQRRNELGSVGFQRAMMCVPLDAASLAFPLEHIERACELGRNPALSPVGGRVIVAVDPAWTVGASADESGIVMVSVDNDGFRHVSHVEGRRCHHDALAARVVELARVNRATVYVESNGAGGVIADIIARRVPCKPLATTATSKRARVEALSAELAAGRWVFRQPLGHPSPDMRKLCEELAVFSFETHAGDRVSALLIACDGVRGLESRPRARWLRLDLHPR